MALEAPTDVGEAVRVPSGQRRNFTASTSTSSLFPLTPNVANDAWELREPAPPESTGGRLAQPLRAGFSFAEPFVGFWTSSKERLAAVPEDHRAGPVG